ncbi:hypothetical protein FA13DRAFT_1754893 [Coprinellus micaceus]|uniref:CxC2-like cysteine cluster KDZ transposase-associated domain-containing protein n=1 Tax=Coprinellus micaceus TaxID=71717 RepID=A0A4Y7TC10_COPMI|nr:hypothetical protein FA13DRAFT_1754893 [Coprinellus micaceus]
MSGRASKAARLRKAEERVKKNATSEDPRHHTPAVLHVTHASGASSDQSSPSLAKRDSKGGDLASSALPVPPLSVDTDIHPDPPKASHSSSPSQTTMLVDEFQACIPQILDLLIEAQNRTVGLLEDCTCGHGKCTVTCFDCTQYPVTCESCFVAAHKHHPLHWAEVWTSKLGCFVRHDISALSPSFSVHLGHDGDRCPFSDPSEGGKAIDITLITGNGVHRTRVRFCSCHGIPDQFSQLMKAGFFPATVKQPRTAFSFSVLDQFQRLQLQCKAAAYDFCATLRRATDDAFTSKVPDIFPQFVIVMQIWRVVTAMKRLGQAHGIDEILRHRRQGNLVVHCPVCPEPHFNIATNWQTIPEHLCQLQLAADGNHQANQYSKNTDPLIRSLFAGRAHFPTDEELKSHLSPTPGSEPDAEKSTCTHLNAADKQDRKKFKNMDITGVVSVQCSHVFIKSMVDLQLGEKYVLITFTCASRLPWLPYLRFTNMDLAYLLALELYRVLDVSEFSLRHITSCDLILSYDIACGYLRHIIARFLRKWPALVEAVTRTQGIIPTVHIQNHQDNCMYLFSQVYKSNTGHFHGEMVEQYWVELNQLGPQTRQMNSGHRHHCIIDHNNAWGWEKTKQIHGRLEADVVHARVTYQQHKIRFDTLCVLHTDKLTTWNKLDWDERSMRGKEVECVYWQSQSKVPSQSAILEALLSEESRPPASTVALSSESTSVAELLDEGIAIQSAQRELERKIQQHQDHSTVVAEGEIPGNTRRLRKRIEDWRTQQHIFMPQVSANVLHQNADSLSAEKERLFLPSDYTKKQRGELELAHPTDIESQLQEGLAFDAIKSVQQYVKCLDELKFDKRLNAHYNANRLSLIALNSSSTARSFPMLTLEDTQRCSASAKRALGDSQRFDGTIWGLGFKLPRPATVAGVGASAYVPVPLAYDVSTQGAHKILKRKALAKPEDDSGSDPKRAKKPGTMGPAANDTAKVINMEDGWIWRLGGVGNLTPQQVKEWEEEGDWVHWFCTKAEMERWCEQWEIKLVEFVRCIKSFSTTANTWTELASEHPSPSYAIYARKKSAVYRQMCHNVETSFASVQVGEPITYRRGEDIVAYIIRHRQTEIGQFHPQYL